MFRIFFKIDILVWFSHFSSTPPLLPDYNAIKFNILITLIFLDLSFFGKFHYTLKKHNTLLIKNKIMYESFCRLRCDLRGKNGNIMRWISWVYLPSQTYNYLPLQEEKIFFFNFFFCSNKIN